MVVTPAASEVVFDGLLQSEKQVLRVSAARPEAEARPCCTTRIVPSPKPSRFAVRGLSASEFVHRGCVKGTIWGVNHVVTGGFFFFLEIFHHSSLESCGHMVSLPTRVEIPPRIPHAACDTKQIEFEEFEEDAQALVQVPFGLCSFQALKPRWRVLT